MASGAGTNFAHIAECVRRGTLELTIERVVCDRPGAGVLEKARSAGVETSLLRWDRARTPRATFDREILETVASRAPDVILLLGWMHILSSEFIRAFASVINIHPAYLPLEGRADDVEMPDGSRIPAFRGARALADAVAAGVKWSGATAHLVTAEVDRGPVLAREAMPLEPGDTLESAFARLRPLEYRVIEAGIRAWLEAQPG